MITNYTTLQDEISGWLKRADLVAAIPTFIQLAEARFNRDLRLPQQQVQLTGVVADNTIQLPSDCRQVQSVRVAIGSYYQEIHPLPPEYLADQVPSTGYAKGYVNVNGYLTLIGGTGSPTFVLTYFQKIPSLSDSLPSNWLLAREPGLYLYGALIEAAPYMQDDERTLVWITQYRDILAGMRAESDDVRYSNTPAMQPPLRMVP